MLTKYNCFFLGIFFLPLFSSFFTICCLFGFTKDSWFIKIFKYRRINFCIISRNILNFFGFRNKKNFLFNLLHFWWFFQLALYIWKLCKSVIMIIILFITLLNLCHILLSLKIIIWVRARLVIWCFQIQTILWSLLQLGLVYLFGCTSFGNLSFEIR